MPDTIDKSKILYDAVSKDYNLGTYDEFKTKLNDSSKRKTFYDALSKDYSLGTYDEFEGKIGFVKGEKPKAPSMTAGYQPQFQLFPESSKDLSAPKTNTEKAINKDRGGVLTYLGGMLDLVKSAKDPLVYLAEEGIMNLYETASGKKISEPERKALRGIGKIAQDMSMPDLAPKEYREKVMSKFNVTDGLGLDDLKAAGYHAVKMTSDLGVALLAQEAGVPMGVTFGATGYADGLKSYDEMVENKEIKSNEKARQVYGIAQGTVSALITKIGFDKILGGGKIGNNILKKITANVLKDISLEGTAITHEAIEKAAQKAVTAEMSGFKKYGLRVLHSNAIGAAIPAVTTTVEPVIQALTNKVQDDQLFDVEQTKKDYLKNLVNNSAMGFLSTTPLAMVTSIGKHTDNHVLETIANAKNDAEVETAIGDLTKTMDKYRFSDEEKTAVLQNAQTYADIKRTIPVHATPEVVTKVIPLIKERRGLDESIESAKKSSEGVDEAYKEDAQKTTSALQAKRESINDEIKSITDGIELKFTEQDGKYYKQFGDNPTEEISKERHDYEYAKEEAERVDKRVQELRTKMAENTMPNATEEQKAAAVDEQPKPLTQEERDNEEKNTAKVESIVANETANRNNMKDYEYKELYDESPKSAALQRMKDENKSFQDKLADDTIPEERKDGIRALLKQNEDNIDALEKSLKIPEEDRTAAKPVEEKIVEPIDPVKAEEQAHVDALNQTIKDTEYEQQARNLGLRESAPEGVAGEVPTESKQPITIEERDRQSRPLPREEQLQRPYTEGERESIDDQFNKLGGKDGVDAAYERDGFSKSGWTKEEYLSWKHCQ